MYSMTDICFLCIKINSNTVVDDSIASQVAYLIPEITLIKLGIPLQICSTCKETIRVFNKFKQSCVQNTQHLEARIKDTQCTDTAAFALLDITMAPESQTCHATDDQLHIDSGGSKIQLHTNNAEKTDTSTSVEMDTGQNVDACIKDGSTTDNKIHDDFKQTPAENERNEDCSNTNQINTDLKDNNTAEGITAQSKAPDQCVEQITIKVEMPEETCNGDEFYNDHSQVTVKQEYTAGTHTNPGSDYESNYDNQIGTGYENQVGIGYENHFDRNQFRTDYENQIGEGFENQISAEQSLYTIKNFCCLCNKSFKHTYEFNRHMKCHQGIKDFQCLVCNKLFRQKHHLKTHMATHTGVKEFQCTVCEKLFAYQKTLKVHMKIHGSKEYQCPICEKLFTLKNHLNLHLKVHARKMESSCSEDGNLIKIERDC